MVQVARENGPWDLLLFLGDWFDLYCVSTYAKDPGKMFQMVREEIKDGVEQMLELQKICRAKTVVFLEGNHEERLRRVIHANIATLSDYIDVRDVLQIPKSWLYLPYGQKGHYKLGKLICTHGTLYNQHVAASMVKKYGRSVIFGHVHRISEYQITNFDGDTLRGICPGWLGDTERAAEYVKDISGWAHGFNVTHWLESGDFYSQIVHIVNYKCVYNGKLYQS